jgi:hypothetical protein
VKIGPEDIAHLTRVAAECNAPGALKRREIPLLLGLMDSSEDVMALTHGLHEDRTWLVALTDRRILLLSRHPFGKPRHVEIPIRDYVSIRHSTGWLHGALDIVTRLGDIRVEDVPKASADPFSAATMRIAREHAASNPPPTSPVTTERMLALHMAHLLV